MAGSLLDIGALTGQAMDLARMAQMQEQATLGAERLEFAKRKQFQDQQTDRISAMTKMGDNELLPTDIRLKIAGRVMKELDPSLEFSDEDLTSGYRSVIAASRKAIDPQVPNAEKIAAWDEAAIRVPGLAGKLQAIQEKSGTIDERRERLYNELELQKLKIRDLKHQQDNIEIREGLYSTAGGILSQLTDSVNLQDADKKRSFTQVFNRAISAKDDLERKIHLAGSKDLEEQFRTKIHGVQQAATMQFAEWRNQLGPLKGAVEQAKAEGRPVDQEDLEKVAALELVTKAEDDINAWVGNPYDKKAWNRVQTTLQQVKVAQSGTKKALKGLDDTRMGMLENARRKTDLEYTKEESKQLGIQHLSSIQQQFAELPDEEQSVQKAAALIKSSGFKDVQVEDVLKANPLKFKKAAAEITIQDRKFTPEQAGRVSAINRAINDLDQAKGLLVKPDGTIDRATLFSANTFGGLPFSKGRDVNRYIEDAVETKLRLETGAAANKDEIKRIAKRFKPSQGDADMTIIGKFDQLHAFMRDAFNVLDPTGEVRGRISPQSAGAPPMNAKTRYEQIKKQHGDWDNKRIYDQMIQEGY